MIYFNRKKMMVVVLIILFIIVITGLSLFFYLNRTVILTDGYYKKGIDVYYRGVLLKRADQKTFEVLSGGFARDYKSTYFKGIEFGYPYSSTFKILSDKFVANREFGYAYNNQKIIRLPNSLGSSFEVLAKDGYAKDENKHYYFDGTDFYNMENKGFEFIENNENYDSRDENHYYLKGKMVGNTEEFEQILASIQEKIDEDMAEKRKTEEAKQKKIAEFKKLEMDGQTGKIVNLEDSSELKETINGIFAHCIKKETHPRLGLYYKIFEIIESPFIPNQYMVLYGLDKEESTNNCCNHPIGYFVVDNGIIFNLGQYYRVSGDYDYGNKYLTYFDYKYIDHIIWTEEGSIFYDLVMAPGNSVQFPSKYNYSSKDLDLLFDIERIGVYTNVMDDLMIREVVSKNKNSYQCDPLARYHVIKKYPNLSNKYTAVAFGQDDYFAWGIYVTDGNKVINSFYEGLHCTECEFTYEIKDIEWENEKQLKFNIITTNEMGINTLGKIIDL
jgi:hypothetical protein